MFTGSNELETGHLDITQLIKYYEKRRTYIFRVRSGEGGGGGRYLFKICFKNLFKTDIFEYIRIYKNKFDESPSPNFLEFKIIEKLIFKEFNSTLTSVVG